eukprot:TRINITY_DN2530_c2_g1_i1.p1 TRINITY_DN2530_c2_g1~~TRINITY_DN2530_c2_g1_i1.p1  ORF type:complete len:107 (+),score=1.91 TRINITY_DN2530_c2_g1_i1:81-401(+)
MDGVKGLIRLVTDNRSLSLMWFRLPVFSLLWQYSHYWLLRPLTSADYLCVCVCVCVCFVTRIAGEFQVQIALDIDFKRSAGMQRLHSAPGSAATWYRFSLIAHCHG